MASEQKNYELAYLLPPSIAEGEVLTHAGKITTLIEGAGGMIRHAEEPRKRKLAYPVKKEVNAYFGWTTFAISPENLAALKKKIVSEEKILRHLLVEEEIETKPQFIRPFPVRHQPVRPSVAPHPAEPKLEEKLDLEALDKKLEEILGK